MDFLDRRLRRRRLVGRHRGDMDAGPNLCADAGADGGGATGGTLDSDGDGVPDCLDQCALDDRKIAPGQCGCNVPDDDTDGDGVADCLDPCPGNASIKSGTVGVCGCGVPIDTPMCLVHRYKFNEAAGATTVADSVTIPNISPANGTAMGSPTFTGDHVTMTGVGQSSSLAGQYIALPPHIISSVGPNITVEAWFTWNPVVAVSDGAWQRIFDFGSSDQGTGLSGQGVTYIFLTPSIGGGNRFARAAITHNGGGGAESVANAAGTFPSGGTTPFHVAVVIDATNSKTISLYFQGMPNGTSGPLQSPDLVGTLNDVNNWIGRSQWAPDGMYAGSIYEFRIYSRALTAAEILASSIAGPDGPVPPPPVDGGVTDGATGAGGTSGTGGTAGASGTGGTAGTSGDASSGQ